MNATSPSQFTFGSELICVLNRVPPSHRYFHMITGSRMVTASPKLFLMLATSASGNETGHPFHRSLNATPRPSITLRLWETAIRTARFGDINS
jgi:hypothetical protein